MRPSRRSDQPRPLERAQLVWLRAVTLSRPGRDRDRFVVMLDLLRTARHGPSTMLHALALGEAQERDAPGDIAIRDAVRLLARTVTWFGKRSERDEIGQTAPSWNRLGQARLGSRVARQGGHSHQSGMAPG